MKIKTLLITVLAIGTLFMAPATVNAAHGNVTLSEYSNGSGSRITFHADRQIWQLSSHYAQGCINSPWGGHHWGDCTSYVKVTGNAVVCLYTDPVYGGVILKIYGPWEGTMKGRYIAGVHLDNAFDSMRPC